MKRITAFLLALLPAFAAEPEVIVTPMNGRGPMAAYAPAPFVMLWIKDAGDSDYFYVELTYTGIDGQPGRRRRIVRRERSGVYTTVVFQGLDVLGAVAAAVRTTPGEDF